MQLSEKVSKEIKNYIVNLLGKDAFVISMEGTCLASPDPKLVGTKVDLPKEVFGAKDTKTIEVKDKEEVLIPLEYQKKTIALLLLDEKIEKLSDYLPLIKSFAELLIQQYYESN
jgi:sugar diacid utilization regulator